MNGGICTVIQITCDSTCDLSRALCEACQIDVIPLGVNMGDDFRYDGVNVTASELYDYVQRTGELPKTSAISVGEYLERFGSFVSKGREVIHISLSGSISSSYQNACIAAQSLGHVHVVDSQNLSTGSGHLAVMAAELASQGRSPEQIVAALEEAKPRVSVSFVLQTLDYLHKGGRCSGVAALGANLLKIHPEIVVDEGAMHVGRKYRGNMEKSISSYVKGCLEGRTDIQHDLIFITHSGVPADLLEKVHQQVAALQPFAKIIETTAGSTISSHCGPNCLGLAFLRKQA